MKDSEVDKMPRGRIPHTTVKTVLSLYGVT